MTDWIVVDSTRPGERDAEGKHLGSKVCRRCGAEEPMPAPPLPLSKLPAVFAAFVEAHKGCLPRD